ncbi:hypothetical protein [Haloechinothrix sp. LS1_15]|uniref:hypothetical protein n=1 Tax=Haloechinothrix sp. LS1_15 TaxID=2652248 RepID=UPI00294B5ABB|nr:hypothetical protein [Haloechinothrix sp. LS1_15]
MTEYDETLTWLSSLPKDADANHRDIVAACVGGVGCDRLVRDIKGQDAAQMTRT